MVNFLLSPFSFLLSFFLFPFYFTYCDDLTFTIFTVDTSTVVTAQNGMVKGLSQRMLKVEGLNNPSGKFHLGLKRAYEMWPADLITRIKEERTASWVKKNQEILAQLHRQMDDPSCDKDDIKERISFIKNVIDRFEDVGQFSCYFELSPPLFSFFLFLFFVL